MKKLILGLLVSSTAFASGFFGSATGGGGGGSGTVTSVGLLLPSATFTISGSPVTTTGTLTGSYKVQNANKVFAGPASGADAVPTFRLLDPLDIPALSYVSSISVTAPIASTGGLTPTISCIAASTSVAGCLSSTDWNTFNGKQAAGNYITALTGDGTAAGPGSAALTLATVNSNVGSFGSSTAIPSFTVNAKGLVTAASTNVVIAPAGTLTGTTLNSTVVTSSLTSVGTITTGTWTGTTIAIANGGTGQTTKAPAFNALSPMTTGGDLIYGGASGAGTRLANGSANQYLASAGGTSAPVWTTFVAPTIQKFLSGSGTYTLPSSPRAPLYIRVVMVGGGGGGAGSALIANANGGAGGTGGNTTFGTTLLVANGGVGGGGGTNGGSGGAGGTASLGTGPVGNALQGGDGGPAQTSVSGASLSGGQGAYSYFGGAGHGATGNGSPGTGITNSGAGGGGAEATNTRYSGSGGGSGGFVDAIITSPSSTYSYAVGAAGAAGAAGTSGSSGGAGGSGQIIVYEYFQ